MKKKEFNNNLPLKGISSLWRLLPINLKKKTIIVLFLSCIGAITEMIGVGLIIPIVALMSDEVFFQNYSFLINWMGMLDNMPRSKIIAYGAVLLFIIYVLKAIYLAFFSLVQARYIFSLKTFFSYELFRRYIYLGYEFHIKNNSSYLIRNLTVELQIFVDTVLIPAMLIITESTIMLGLGMLLFIFEPKSTTVLLSIVFFTIYIFQRITKKYLLRLGRERQNYEGIRIKNAQESLFGIKDVKFYRAEENFLRNYNNLSQKISNLEGNQHALSSLPRLWIETVAVLSLTILIITLISNSQNPNAAIPIIALFAAVAFRIMPSANRMLNSIQVLRYSEPIIDLFSREIIKAPNYSSKLELPIYFNNKIKLNNVSYKYPDTQFNSLNNINLVINKGTSIGIIGPSGSGKSTLIDLILGFLEPTSGTINIDDTNITGRMADWQKHIGYVPQDIFLLDDTIKRNIAFGLDDREINDHNVEMALQSAQLGEFINGLPKGLDTNVGERGVSLSGGQCQRIGIARALYRNPDILVFDEATSSLDVDTETEVIRVIESLKGFKTIIIVTHRLSVIEHCDKVYKLHLGKLV